MRDPIQAHAQHLRRHALTLDTETTGSNQTHDEVIELGLVRALDGAVLLNQRFCPTKDIEPGAYRVHGISRAQLRGAPSFVARWPGIAALLADRLVVGWNVAFDRQMLAVTCRKYGLTMPAVEWVDLMPLYRRFKGLAKNCKLSVACEHEKVRGGAHSAQADALAVARVLFRMAGPAIKTVAAPPADELFQAPVTHVWEVPEVENWYAEHAEDEDAAALVAVQSALPVGTADAYLTPAGELVIPSNAKPAYCYWRPGGQSISTTLQQLSAPPDVLSRYCRRAAVDAVQLSPQS